MDSAKCCRPSLHRESISFMKGVMDECTHMANFSGKFYGADSHINQYLLTFFYINRTEKRKYHSDVTGGV